MRKATCGVEGGLPPDRVGLVHGPPVAGALTRLDLLGPDGVGATAATASGGGSA